MRPPTTRRPRAALLALFASAVLVPSLANAAHVPPVGFEKFAIPEDFPGDFFIDFLAVSVEVQAAGLLFGGSLSDESEILFSVGDPIAPGSDEYALSVAPAGFVFKEFGVFVVQPMSLDFVAIGDGVGTFNAATRL